MENARTYLELRQELSPEGDHAGSVQVVDQRQVEDLEDKKKAKELIDELIEVAEGRSSEDAFQIALVTEDIICRLEKDEEPSTQTETSE